MERVTDTLVAVDARLDRLAEEASQHVGVQYRNTGLSFFHGWGAEISGGPSGVAGDIWFELCLEYNENRGFHAPPWVMESDLVVFCDRQRRGEARGYSCTHPLVSLRDLAMSPVEALRLFSDHIERLSAEVKERDPREFTATRHENLPSCH